MEEFTAVTVGKLLQESLLITGMNFGGEFAADCLHFISILRQHRATKGGVFQPKCEVTVAMLQQQSQ